MPFVFTGGAIGIFLQWLHRCHNTGGSGGGIVFGMRPTGRGIGDRIDLK
jgi:hypothetical protein